MVFSLIALIAVLQVVRKDLLGLTSIQHTAMDCSYAILSNIPVFSKNSSTLVIHSIAFLWLLY